MDVRVELAGDRLMRSRNTGLYRALHWPLWIFVFVLAPGPFIFDLFAGRPSRWTLVWLLLVLLGTGLAVLRGRLPGAEPTPYILRFTEDRPNPLYRRICYTFGWNAAVNFALINLLGLAIAVSTGRWLMHGLYTRAYPVVLLVVLALGASGRLPRTGPSTKGEGTERRFFYGMVWAVTLGQAALLVCWKTLPRTHTAEAVKLAVYVAVLGAAGLLGANGLLPRTRPIVAGESVAAD